MEEDITLKIFILENELGKELDWHINSIAKKFKYKIKTKFSTEEKLLHLPKDYDSYILHLSNTTEESIRKLRKEQPWCKIFGMTGGDRIENLLDRTFYILDDIEVKYILEETKKIYTEKGKKNVN